MTRKTTTPYCRERRIFFAAFSLLLILFCAYIYFVSASIVHVIVRKEIDREAAYLSSRIGDLETAYIAAQQAIDDRTVSARGFNLAQTGTVYVRQVDTNPVLVLNDES